MVPTILDFFDIFRKMRLITSIFILSLHAGATLANITTTNANVTEYEFKFRTADYIKEVNNMTTLPNARLHICRLPDEERVKLCKDALKEEFSADHRIKYREGQPLGDEKMYEIKLNGVFYVGMNAPLYVSACMCPTKPPIYLKDKSCGTDVRVYVDLHYGEDEHGFTKSD